MEKLIVTPEQAVERIEKWFYHYYRSATSPFTGVEPFTPFSVIVAEKQQSLINAMDLAADELPVLVLSCADNTFIVNTTLRFKRGHASGTESLFYADFKGHKGYKTWVTQFDNLQAAISVKTAGSFAEFGMETIDGQIIYWLIPTGKPGFAFWNVTNRLAYFARKYLIQGQGL